MQSLKRLERVAKKLVPQGWRKHLRASKYELLMERRAPIDLIVHVGAHWGEDAAFYELCGAKTILWIEADPDTYQKLTKALAGRSKTTRHVTENTLVSATGGETLTFNRFNGDGASSSIYNSTDVYRKRFPHSHETGEVIQLTTHSLPDILARHDVDVRGAARSMLAVDVQGHELSVLKGLGDDLKQFHQCKCEVSRVPMYEGGALFEDIDAYMRSMGFRLASHRYVQVPRHGDVLYIRA
ncbi:FkbM family methyltransferase [Tropicibacter sp. Alg240-R139]|uniref:FkbM family methyltransferase n=1 Tax=Tropicibacter sp. Alg240-R139 TaxID=2305991 RepID=UPI0013DFD2B4|nr:FkbM family methyltransferase [Tropicibacter sp. Alg240-R139]